MTAFEEFGLMPEIGQSIEEMDWMLPTDVQAEAIPLILGGGDVLMAAETGSGKTGAFCLPIIQMVYETLRDIKEGKGKKQSFLSDWALNQHDSKPGLSIDPERSICENHTQQWLGCRANKAISTRIKGKYYYEVSITEENGLVRVGWSSKQASFDLGTDRLGFGFGGTGKKSFNKQFDTYGESFTFGDTIGCYLNTDDHTIKFSKNGKDFGMAYKIPDYLKETPLYPSICLKNSGVKVNFGKQPLSHLPTKEEYTPLCNAPKEVIVDESTINALNSVNLSGKKPSGPLALIIEPSRELAEQTYKVITTFSKHMKDPAINALLVVGGSDSRSQITALTSNTIHIVVSTPGRLEDLVFTSSTLNLESTRFFVLDEADALLKAGHLQLINKLRDILGRNTNAKGVRLQVVVCSATLRDFDVKKMAESVMTFPIWVDLKGQDSIPETVHHVVVMVDPRRDKLWERLKNPIKTDGVHSKDTIGPNFNNKESFSEAVKILKAEYTLRAINEHKMDKCIIFCRTKLDCDNLENYIMKMGGGTHAKNNPYSCACLHSDRNPQERRANLESFKQGQVKFLICTDVAARGIDITGLPYTINVTLPDEKSNYLHRIGRVGRVDKMGLAISLVSAVPEKVWYHKCPNRGKNCFKTNLITEGGCTIWYNEPQYLADIEEHLGITIQQIDPDIKVPLNEFDGKVIYGAKRKEIGSGYEGHMLELAPKIQALAALEKIAQDHFLRLTKGFKA
ncbi:unnamed protein product [Gordionus sp. m RMFG-2023]|uniref:ATP-dependent RNA helicase DDX1-like n=1 Tax=Gordionus sp. m RMFG-2023 TaxID=3053472 RepID=UPI0030DED58E